MIGVLAVSVLLAGGTAVYYFANDHSVPSGEGASAVKRENGTYLGTLTDRLAQRVTPPSVGEEAERADRLAFESTRALKGSQRWTMASHDAKISTKSMLTSFSCAAGIELDRDQLPKLSSLLQVAQADAVRVSSGAKHKYERTRPYVAYGGETCKSPKKLKEEGDYPSGHSARGWTFGLILADLIPERATELRERADSYAQSRVICGLHSKSGIEGGRSVATLTLEALKQNAAFERDFDSAEKEFAAFKRQAQPPPGEVCRWEQDVLKKRY